MRAAFEVHDPDQHPTRICRGYLPGPPGKTAATTCQWLDHHNCICGWVAGPPRSQHGMSTITAKVQVGGCIIVDGPNRSISPIMALPVGYGEDTADDWYCLPTMAQDGLSLDDLDMVCAYMSNPMQLGVPSKGPPTKPWWETCR